jgi:hypothetical protein
MASQHDTPSGFQSFKGKNKKSLSWQAAGTDSIKNVVVAVTDSGNSIMFSRTMDGGALVVALYMGNVKAKEYITEAGDIPALFAWCIENFS